MGYHDLSSSTLTDDERRAEADKLCKLIVNDSDAPMRWTDSEEKFVDTMGYGGFVSIKQLFWLRDILDKYR